MIKKNEVKTKINLDNRKNEKITNINIITNVYPKKGIPSL